MTTGAGRGFVGIVDRFGFCKVAILLRVGEQGLTRLAVIPTPRNALVLQNAADRPWADSQQIGNLMGAVTVPI